MTVQSGPCSTAAVCWVQLLTRLRCLFPFAAQSRSSGGMACPAAPCFGSRAIKAGETEELGAKMLSPVDSQGAAGLYSNPNLGISRVENNRPVRRRRHPSRYYHLRGRVATSKVFPKLGPVRVTRAADPVLQTRSRTIGVCPARTTCQNLAIRLRRLGESGIRNDRRQPSLLPLVVGQLDDAGCWV